MDTGVWMIVREMLFCWNSLSRILWNS